MTKRYASSLWQLSVTLPDMNTLRREYGVPRGMVFEVPRPDEGAIDPKRYAYKVALFLSMFLDGLRLPFYHLVRDVLDMEGVALSQIHHNSWKILMGCYVIWRRALEEMWEA